jgi:hypothetical protein
MFQAQSRAADNEDKVEAVLSSAATASEECTELRDHTLQLAVRHSKARPTTGCRDAIAWVLFNPPSRCDV